MNYSALYDRILQAVDTKAYLPYADVVQPDQREAMQEIGAAISSPDFDPASVRSMVNAYHQGDRIDKVMYYSALHVIAASPRVRDFDDAARLVALQENAALELGGAHLAANLASVERHRGVLAFLQNRPEVALDYFTRAFERQHSAGNLANVLAAMLRLGEEREARTLLHQIRGNLPTALVSALDDMIALDPDLALLR